MKKRGFILSFDAVCYLLALIVFVTAGVYGFSTYIENAKHSTAKNQIATLVSAVSHYHYDMGEYPADLDTLKEPVGAFGPWIAVKPKDPWNDDYEYKKSDTRFVIYSKAGKSDVDLSPDTIPEKTSAIYAYGQ